MRHPPARPLKSQWAAARLPARRGASATAGRVGGLQGLAGGGAQLLENVVAKKALVPRRFDEHPVASAANLWRFAGGFTLGSQLLAYTPFEVPHERALLVEA